MAKPPPPRKPDVARLLDKLAGEEELFLSREFLAPVPDGNQVQVRIAGVVCTIRIQPRDFSGWGVFQPLSHTDARLVRSATLAERQGYLKLFPRVRLVICRRDGRQWLAGTASYGDGRFRIEGLVPVELPEAIEIFDVIHARYDGARFWFDELDTRHDPGTAAYLRAAFARKLPPNELDRPGLTAEERAAYELNYWKVVQPVSPAAEADVVQQRLRENLSHAGAELISYLEHSDTFRVTYTVGGRQYTSAIDKGDLSVQVAGICLSGEDEKFDLASLVGVLREAEGEGHIVPVGERGLAEEQYWRVHPRRNP